MTAQLETPGQAPVRMETMGNGRTVGELGFYLGIRRTAAVIVKILAHLPASRLRSPDSRKKELFIMKKWYAEDWRFKIEVLRVGKENLHSECRIGLEPGDIFECTYETPAGFCPTSFIKIFPGMEVVRCGGDLRNLGGKEPGEITFLCPDGVVLFRVTAGHLMEKAITG